MIAHRLNRRAETAGMRAENRPEWYCDCGEWSTRETDETARQKAHHRHVSTIRKTMDVICSRP